MNKPIVRGWVAIVLFGAIATATTEPLYDRMAPLIGLSCVALILAVAFYAVRPLRKAAFLAPTFFALALYFLMLVFRTSSVSSLFLALMIVSYIASFIMAITGRPKGRVAD